MPAESEIFRYHDGQRDRWADPLELYLDSQAILLRDGLGERVRNEDPQAIKELVAKLRDLLQLEPVSQGADGQLVGVTTKRVLETYQEFQTYAESLKNGLGPSAISPSPTDVEHLDLSITRPDSACSSIASELSTGKPSPSPLALV